ncbi:hypothetical protein GFV01_01995 [Apibacter sp. B2912]|nr:hypothetical protein [Apibacter sp. B2912]
MRINFTKMSIIIDKRLILNNIKNHLGFKTQSDFAKFLGIAPTTLSSWYARNTFDMNLVYSKCSFLNTNWLLTGEGEMLKSKVLNNNLEPDDNFEEIQALTDIAFYDIQLSEEKLKKANKRIELLEELVESYKLEINDLKNELSKGSKK